MKISTLFILLSLIGINTGYSQSRPSRAFNEWNNFAVLEKSAIESPQKILVYVHVNWCGWCKKMENEILNDTEIKQVFRDNFYQIKFDGESREHIKFSGKDYKFNSNIGKRGMHELTNILLDKEVAYPALVVLDENYRTILVLRGYKKKEVLLTELLKIL